MNNQVTIIN